MQPTFAQKILFVTLWLQAFCGTGFDSTDATVTKSRTFLFTPTEVSWRINQAKVKDTNVLVQYLQ
jgi:phage host-nuclease inhibitor protein Gam